MSGHTPGPWSWIPSSDGTEAEYSILVRPTTNDDPGDWEDVILAVLDDTGIARDYVEGGGRDYCAWNVSAEDARLIAAAPELLAACEAVVNSPIQMHSTGFPDVDEQLRAIRRLASAAITKATLP